MSRQEVSDIHDEDGVAQLLLNFRLHHIKCFLFVLYLVGACLSWQDAADAVEIVRVRHEMLDHGAQILNYLQCCDDLSQVLVLGHVGASHEMLERLV